MPAFIDLAGKTFGRLTVLRRAANNSAGRTCWECECECGARVVFPGAYLQTGDTKSCGCLRRDVSTTRFTTHGHTHGRHQSPTYTTWLAMIQRCRNPNEPGFHRYGGRGITVCEHWLVFENFLTDMGERPDGLTIERINNNGNYEPGNCRWADRGEQARNRRTNRLVTIGEQTRCLEEWIRIFGLNPKTVANRLRYGWSEIQALTTPSRRFQRPSV